MALETVLTCALIEPSPESLWALQPYVLGSHGPEAAAAQGVAQAFYCYLTAVRSKLTSKQYSALAAKLAAISVGVIATQDILHALGMDRRRAIQDVLSGGLAESLEVISTLQHVKAWETEFASLHDEAAWNLYQSFWRLSEETLPDLASERRRDLLDSLLAPARRADLGGMVRTALIIRLYQVLLAIRLAPLLQNTRAVPQADGE